MVTVDGFPYWADAVGQIPFAVDNATDMLEKGKTPTQAVVETIKSGKKFGEGKLFGVTPDNSNSYDNHWVLRGALYAVNKYKYDQKNKSMSKTEHNPSLLKMPIDKKSKDTFLK